MDRDTIKSKIVKLLALSADNPSDEESYSALMKAQALMAQYKIDEGEINPDRKEECIHVETEFSYGSSSSDTYLNELAKILAENFCCVNYVSKKYRARTRNVNFMGLKKDVDVVIEAMKTANDAIIRGYYKVWYDMCKAYHLDYIPAKYFNPAKLGYIKGYLKGLKEVLESQRDQIQEWGLVLVAPQEAQDFLNGLSSSHIKSQSVSNTYYDQGYQDGKNFNMNKKIDSSNLGLIE